MDDWIECTLGDIVTLQRGHDLSSKKMKNGPYPVMGSNGVIGCHNEFIAEPPCITIGRSGNVGNPRISFERIWCHNTTMYVKKFNNSDPLFCYYLLQSLNLNRFAGGSAVPTLNRNHLHPIKIKIPHDIEKQEKIGLFLNSFDALIEQNRKINDYLAKIMALKYKALYDFESYDKSQMVDSEFGPIPNSWSIKTVSSFSNDMKNGATPSRSNPDYWDKGTIPWITTSEVHDNIIIDTKEKITEAGLNNSSTKILPINTVIMALYGKGTASRLALLKIEATTNQACCAMITDSSNKASFLYQTLLNMREYVDSLTSGSVQQNLSKEIVANLKFVCPPDDVIEKTNLGSLSEMMYANAMQSNTLQQLRDVLLPKLTSGEIDVSDFDLGN